MPSRTIPFINGQYYHIYNRGSEKRNIFESKRDYKRFLKTFYYYQHEGPKPKFSHFNQFTKYNLQESKKIVAIIAYCLMPNHFHFLLKQLKENGITEFISKLSNSYTKFYNTKYKRVGPLFQGEFKSVLVENDDQLLHLSRYIHLNPVASFLVKELSNYPWSSYFEFIGLSSASISSKEDILGFFKTPKDYRQFVVDQQSYSQQLWTIKHKVIEEI